MARITKEKPPSSAQAKILARLFGLNETIPVGQRWRDPTIEVLIKREWITPDGEKGKFPNGDDYVTYKVSHSGLRALEIFLINYLHANAVTAS